MNNINNAQAAPSLNLTSSSYLQPTQGQFPDMPLSVAMFEDTQNRVFNLTSQQSQQSPQFNELATFARNSAGRIDQFSNSARPLDETGRQMQAFRLQLSVNQSQAIAQNSFQQRIRERESVSDVKNFISGSSLSTPSFSERSSAKSTPKPSQRTTNMEVKKTQFARCVQISLDPESPYGATRCLAHHSKGLSEAEKKELSDFEPNAITGTAINNLAAIPAVVSRAAKIVSHVLIQSAISEAVLTTDPANYETRMNDMQVALSGQNPEFNKGVKEIAPAWVLSTRNTLVGWGQQLDLFDKSMQDQYRTIPGLVMEGTIGTAEIAVAIATGSVINGAVNVVRMTGQGVKTATSAVKKAAANRVKEYRLNDSPSTYSYTNPEGQTVTVTKKYKTYYQPPQRALKPFSGQTAQGSAASRTKANPASTGNNPSVPSLYENPLPLSGAQSNIKYVSANSLKRQGLSIKPSSPANSNLLPVPPFAPAMVVNGPRPQNHYFPNIVNTGKNGSNQTPPSYQAPRMADRFKSQNATKNNSISSKPSLLSSFIKDEFGGGNNWVSSFGTKFKKDSKQNIQKIFETATHVPKGTLEIPSKIDVNAVMDGKLVKEYGKYSRNPTAGILGDIKTSLSISDINTTALANPSSGNRILLVSSFDGSPKAVLKEFIATRSLISGFIPEIVALKILERQGLKSSLPELLWVGKYKSFQGAEKGLALYKHISGVTMYDAVMANMPNTPTYEYGRAIGEINAVNHSLPVSEAYLNFKIAEIKSTALNTFLYLIQKGILTRLTMEIVDAISRDVLKRPGISGLVHGDAHHGNFIFEEITLANGVKNTKTNVIDPGSLLNSVNRFGQALGLPSMDFYQAINCFKVLRDYDEMKGISGKPYIDTFVKGYRDIFKGSFTYEAERFSELFWDLMTLNYHKMSNSSLDIIKIRLESMERMYAPPKINGETIMSSKDKQPTLESQYHGRNVKIREKAKINYQENQLENAKVEALKQKMPAIVKSSDFPKHYNQFIKECTVTPYVLPNKYRDVNVTLVHKQVRDALFFLMKRDVLSLGKTLYKKNFDHLLDAAINYSRENGFKTIFLAWNPERIPLLAKLESRSLSIEAISEFSTGVLNKPMTVVELKLS